jgi:hypothetical protein
VRANCAIDPAGGSFTNQETGEPFSATNMRRAIANRNKELISFIPPEAHDRMDDIEDILAMNESKVKEPITLENLFNMVEEVMEEDEENIEEISAMGGGAVAGYSLPLGAKPRKINKKKRKGRRIYIPD